MLPCLILATLAAASPSPPKASAPVVTLKFIDNGKLISLPVRIGASSPVLFTLDSGATVSNIDTRTARRLGMHAVGIYMGHGAGAGAVRFAVYHNVQLSAGSARWIATTAWGSALHSVESNVPESGLLGSDLFLRYVVDIDYASHHVSLYDPASYRYAGSGTAIRIKIERRLPKVDVTIGVQGRAAQAHEVLIDSGSEDDLDDPLVAESTAPKRYYASQGLGRSERIAVAPVEWIEIGPYRLRRITGASGNVPIIGSGILRRFHVVFDYPHSRVYFQPTGEERTDMGSPFRRPAKRPADQSAAVPVKCSK